MKEKMQEKERSSSELLTFEKKVSEPLLDVVLQNLLKEAKVYMMIYNLIRSKAKSGCCISSFRDTFNFVLRDEKPSFLYPCKTEIFYLLFVLLQDKLAVIPSAVISTQ